MTLLLLLLLSSYYPAASNSVKSMDPDTWASLLVHQHGQAWFEIAYDSINRV